jgi:hypothetical protein
MTLFIFIYMYMYIRRMDGWLPLFSGARAGAGHVRVEK